MISLIVCKTRNNVIGVNNTLPWKQKNDMQRFKALTLNKALVMGRKTFESFGAKPLPNRLHHMVLTRTDTEKKNTELGADVKEISFWDKEFFDIMYVHYTWDNQEFMIIGGQQIYEQFMPHADTLYVTELDVELEGDTYFPAIDLEVWKLAAQEHYKADENNQHDYSFLTYVRK